jgi:hypothetical protein
LALLAVTAYFNDNLKNKGPASKDTCPFEYSRQISECRANKEHGLGVFVNGMLRIFGPKRNEVRGG